MPEAESPITDIPTAVSAGVDIHPASSWPIIPFVVCGVLSRMCCAYRGNPLLPWQVTSRITIVERAPR